MTASIILAVWLGSGAAEPAEPTDGPTAPAPFEPGGEAPVSTPEAPEPPRTEYLTQPSLPGSNRHDPPGPRPPTHPLTYWGAGAVGLAAVDLVLFGLFLHLSNRGANELFDAASPGPTGFPDDFFDAELERRVDRLRVASRVTLGTGMTFLVGGAALMIIGARRRQALWRRVSVGPAGLRVRW